MPDVRISVTDEFLRKVHSQLMLCQAVREVVSVTFGIELPAVAVKLEHYAPGCEDGCPGITVGVTIDQGERAPKQGKLVQELAHMVKSIADAAAGRDVGKVKAMIDLGLRKTATVGE